MTTKTDELNALKEAREEFYATGVSLNDMVTSGKILAYKADAVVAGNYNVNIHVVNSAIEDLERAIAREAKTAVKPTPMCPKHHIALTLGRCDECDDWDN